MTMPWIGYSTAEKSLKNDFARPFCTPKTEKRILFLKNEPVKLLKTNDKPKKTNRKRSGNEATEVVENKGRAEKTNRKRTEERACIRPADSMPQGCLACPPLHALRKDR